MNYIEYQNFRKDFFEKPRHGHIIDLGETSLYKTIHGPELSTSSPGHVNGNVHRCHLAEDFCRINNINYTTRENMIITYGVRDSLNLIAKNYSGQKWIIPSDVYPYYIKCMNDNKIEYKTYSTLNGYDLDNLPDGDILLICYPSKPSGHIMTKQDILKISAWKQKNINRMVVIDCAYVLNMKSLVTDDISLMMSLDFTLLFSLSKIWSHPNIMGLGILSTNMISIRNIVKNKKHDTEKLHMAYNLMHKNKDFSLKMYDILKEKEFKMNKLFTLPSNQSIPGYLFWIEQEFCELLANDIMSIPASVFGGKNGSIISSLNI